ncbi:erythrocyte membrane protein 1, EMP1 [Plasmodium reichenowi]|uniref:Erythrocyte membrane protein 1, EMP1 n=1 Tax=Plasmodium reichenowi TaxID=5854 RepID=A0A060RLU1_PLARE|nr:erythrocyte membrane protein 1, EMP1 [Plasmodium reichenowi]
MLRVLQIPQNDYGMPTTKSSNKYIPYASGKYRGKRYIYLEGDSGTDSGYTDHYSDITSSSESEYEEFDINDIYVPHAPKYKTLIEVVLEPSKRDTQNDIQNNIQNDDTPGNKFTDNEWNTLKDEFISNMLQNEQPNDVPNDYTSGNIPTNTNNTTPSRHNVDNNTHPTMSSHNVDNNNHPTTSHDNVDNNTHPTMSRHTLDQKPFIMSIHDRNLLSGEEYNYDMINNIGIYPSSSNRHSLSGTKDPYSGKNGPYSGTKGPYSGNRDSYSDKNGPTSGNHNLLSDNHHPYSGTKDPYSGIDLINDSLNSGNQPIDIYDEILKRKENELFGTNHRKHTNTYSVAKHTNSDDPIHNQLELFHKWLDRHRNMCEKWDKNNKEQLLDKLKEKWDNETHSGNLNSGNITLTSDNTPPNSDIPSGKLSDIPSDNNIHSDIHPSDIPSGKLSDIPSGKLSDTPSDNIHSGNKHSGIHSGNKNSNIPSNIHSSNKTLNSDVSIQIDMDNPKTTNEFTYVDSNPNQVDNINPNLVGNINPVYSNTDNSSIDTILEDLEKTYNEPYYYDIYDDDIYYDVNDDNDTSTVNPNNMEKPTKIQIELDVNNHKLVKEKYPISDIWNN